LFTAGGFIMRLERLTYNKIKIFLTTDDLSERGLTKEDIWKDSLKWHQLFHEMLEEASEQFDVDIQGTVAVEIFTMHAQGMVMIVTMDEQEEEESSLLDSFYDLQVSVKEKQDLIYEFNNFELVIQVSHQLNVLGFTSGSLYVMDDTYYFCIENVEDSQAMLVAVVLSEYSNPSLESIHRIVEYGKPIIEQEAVETIVHYFK
jgi:adapter protein MecA 1/2